MFEIIIDVTNRCFHQCLLCGTGADRTGNISLDAKIIEEIICFVKDQNIFLYLGGGCFFCHPEHFRILKYMKTTQAKNIIIDVPPCKEVMDTIQKYPMYEYCYNISTSLWGIGNVHDNLSNSLSFKYVKQLGCFMKKNQDSSFETNRYSWQSATPVFPSYSSTSSWTACPVLKPPRRSGKPTRMSAWSS